MWGRRNEVRGVGRRGSWKGAWSQIGELLDCLSPRVVYNCYIRNNGHNIQEALRDSAAKIKTSL